MQDKIDTAVESEVKADASQKPKARDSKEYETMLLDLVRDEIKGL